MPWEGTDAELVALARGNPAKAAGFVYDRFSNDVNRLVWRVLGADVEHDDVVHQAFVHIISGLAKVRDPEALGVWVGSVCVKTVRSEIRRRRVRRLFMARDAESARIAQIAAPIEDHEARDLLEKTYSILEKLPADERIAFALRYIDERPLLEVAEACACSLATIKRRLRKAERRFARLAVGHAALTERLARVGGSESAPRSPRHSKKERE
jgi:RNA polymerase sigma-70 factor, ECF subfamily